jgi:hypothetical protein
LRDFSQEEKAIVLRIIDDGGVPSDTMMNTATQQAQSFMAKTIQKAMQHGLMEITPGQGPVRVVPSLMDAIRFIIETEDEQGKK